jgi:putative heme-binding domain-containing protein
LINFLRTYRDQAVSERATRLFGPLIARRPEVVKAFVPALRLKGEASRGRNVFLARCADCHQFGSQGQAFGPDLSTAREKGKDRLLAKILEPNADVPAGAAACVVETKDAENLLGRVEDENLASVTVQQPTRVRATWPRTNVQAIHRQPWSLMPEGLEQGLSTQEMADLLEFLAPGVK